MKTQIGVGFTVLLALAAPVAANALGISDGNTVTRSSEGVDLSGITWAGGDMYSYEDFCFSILLRRW